MKKLHALTFLVCGLALAGCGKKEEAPATTAAAPAPAPAATTPAAPAVPAPAVSEITANDAMKFNLTRFEVAAGQEVKLTLTNMGTMPKVAMGHNLVILKKDAD